MKDVYDCETVKRLFKSGMKIKAIARTLKMSKNTVKKLIKAEEAPRYKREYYKTKIDEYVLHFELYILPNHVTISLFKGERILFSISKENVKVLKILNEVMRIEFINDGIIEISLNPLKIKANL